jgi:rhomboid family GlyGly-CTERM serine protease
LWPGLQALLIYDRAAITAGEYWRLATGSIVHLSGPHLAANIAALLIAGGLLEFRRIPRYATLFLCASVCSGAALYVAQRELLYFGGLSGVVTAAVVFLCLHGLKEEGKWKVLCMAALALICLKVGLELSFGRTLLSYAPGQAFVPAPLSHAAGALTALLLFLLSEHARRGQRRADPAASGVHRRGSNSQDPALD